MVLSVSFIAYEIYKSTFNKTTNKLYEKMIEFHFETFAQLSKIYLKDTNNYFVQNIEKSLALRNNFEDMLRLIKISTVQHLFVVTKDSDQNYFFLLDSDTNSTVQADIYEPFNPLSDIWDKCYDLKKPQVFHHNNSKDLWITIAYPIVENNSTVALIGADISHALDVNIQIKLQNFGNFFIWILLLSICLLVILYMAIFYFRKKVYDGYIDPLTQLYNRRYLYEILMKKLSRKYQLFMVDIDFFKNVNDTYGHDAGDAILQEVANRLNALTRDEDSLIRFGGEEFLIYTTRLKPKQCVEFAERLRENIKEKPIHYKDIECKITVSIGCYPYGTKHKAFAEILKKADEALYLAKASGRDCVKVVK